MDKVNGLGCNLTKKEKNDFQFVKKLGVHLKNKSSERASEALITLINLTYYYCHKGTAKIQLNKYFPWYIYFVKLFRIQILANLCSQKDV